MVNQSESTSNYGGLSSHIGQQSYALPVKGAVNQKRLALQKANQNSQKVNSSLSASSGAVSVSNNHKRKRDINSENLSVNSRTNTSNVRDTPNLHSYEQVSQNNDDYNNSMDDYFPSGNAAAGRSHQNKLKKSNKDNKNSQSTDIPPPRARSINITEEALRIGKVPTEEVALNIAKNRYNKDGLLIGSKREQQNKLTRGEDAISPRVVEMLEISAKIKESFKKTGDAP